MAAFGAIFPCFKPDNKEQGVVIGKLVSANLTVTMASGELYADDGLDEQLSEFANGNVAMETNDMTDDVAGDVYGCTVKEKEVTYNKGDNSPWGVLGYCKCLMIDGNKKYKAYIYPRAKAALGNDNAQTKGSSITFQTTATTFAIKPDENGNWRITKTFDTEAEVRAYIREKTAIPDASGAAGEAVQKAAKAAAKM